jgi:tripartite-type tricarboxylate transporter receptor subunit TctC
MISSGLRSLRGLLPIAGACLLLAGMSTPSVIERLNAGGTQVFWSGPQEFTEFVQTELAKWTAAIKEAGIEPE